MKKIIFSNKAPDAIGPYSQAVVYNGLVYTSGQIPIDKSTGLMITDDIDLEVEQVINNLKFVLEEAGSSFNNVLKFTVYLTDMSLFPFLNKIFEKYFIDSPPARSTVEVSSLPKNARVEIDAIGFIG
tara:strand:- start:276 stop:656 length:381 start_codon:yes stop_codon:yes gene_type:complete